MYKKVEQTLYNVQAWPNPALTSSSPRPGPIGSICLVNACQPGRGWPHATRWMNNWN